MFAVSRLVARIRCVIYGHGERRPGEIEGSGVGDGDFIEVTFFCWRCQQPIATIPWEEAPEDVKNALIVIRKQFYPDVTYDHWQED